MSITGNIEKSIKEKELIPALTLDDRYLCMIDNGECKNAFPIHSKAFSMAFKMWYSKKYNVSPMTISMEEVVYFLELKCFEFKLDYELSNRIHNDTDGTIYYDLNKDTEAVVQIKDGKCTIGKMNRWISIRSNTFKNQVTPDFNVNEKCIFDLVKKHFNIRTEHEHKLFVLYLVSCFYGLKLNVPLLAVIGSKGSSKSTSLRKLERIVDPKITDLYGMPQGANLELRLSNAYMVALDNLSSLSHSQSDLLCRAVTGGSYSKRKLYCDTEEVAINIKALVAINGVSMVCRESDLLDRVLMINLKRIESDKMLTEEAIWKEFERDLPALVGCCFKTLAKALMVEDKSK